MANPKNAKMLALIEEHLEATTTLLITEYRGLTVAEMSQIRRALGSDVTYAVVKNTLTKLALRKAGIEGLDGILEGPSAVAFIRGEAVDAAKAMKEFSKEHKNFVIKGGYLDGNVLDDKQVLALAELDNRETTLAKLAGALKATTSKAAGLFNAPASQVARLAAALQEKKQAA